MSTRVSFLPIPQAEPSGSELATVTSLKRKFVIIPKNYAAYPAAYPDTGVLITTGDDPNGLYTVRFPDGRIVHGDMGQDPGPYIERFPNGAVVFHD